MSVKRPAVHPIGILVAGVLVGCSGGDHPATCEEARERYGVVLQHEADLLADVFGAGMEADLYCDDTDPALWIEFTDPTEWGEASNRGVVDAGWDEADGVGLGPGEHLFSKSAESADFELFVEKLGDGSTSVSIGTRAQ